MKVRFQPWQLAALFVLLSAAAVGGIYFLRFRTFSGPGAMLACMPESGATLAYLNVADLRRSGILDIITGSKAAEDLEYQGFVEGTGFDYRRDLDAVAASFVAGDAYFLLSGRFDWQKLNAYALSRGGVCHNTLCRTPTGSTGRFVSFYPVRSSLLAIAFSSNEYAALSVSSGRPETPIGTDAPVWMRVPAAALRDAKLPAGTQAFASPLTSAQNIVFSIAPKDSQMEIRLAVTCDSVSAASDLLIKMEGATSTLRKFIEREHMQPNPKDLSGLLTAGTFRRDDRRVDGSWPLRRELIETVAAGGVN